MSTFDETLYYPDLELLDRVNRKRAEPETDSMSDLVAGRLFERLALVNTRPERILDLGAGDGRHLKLLRERFPRAVVYAADASISMLLRARAVPFFKTKPPVVCSDASQLPFADESFDLVVSNLMLPWVYPPDRVVAELNRVLTTNGVFFLSSAGPDTLCELRAAWSSIDSAVHVNALVDMHDLGDVLMRTGIADPVVDVERLQVNYSSIDTLLDELIANGAFNVLAGRRRGLIGSDIRDRLARAYPCNEQGDISATLELVYAHGWKGLPTTPAGRSGNEVFVSLDSLRRNNNSR